MTGGRGGLLRAKYIAIGLLILGLVIFPIVVNVSFIISLMVLVAIFAIIAMGFDILAGYAGQVSLGQAAFVGLGGYTTAYVTTRLGWAPLLGIAAGLVLTLIVAYFIGLVTLRLPRYYFPLATMGLSVIFEACFISFRDITGGPSGFTGIPTFSVGGLSVNKDIEYYYFLWGLAAAFLVVSRLIVNSAIGRAFRAIERDELAASMMGVDVARYKMMAFLISVGYASIGGSMLAHYMRFLSPDVVGLFASFSIVSITVVGGMGTLFGAFLGGALLKGMPEAFTALKDYMLLINGFAILVILIFLPQGLVGGLQSLLRRWEMSRAQLSPTADEADDVLQRSLARPTEGKTEGRLS
ncbi:MAG: branched-chain amino acid ABC transporter permease [Chloroflexi bacterium]|nr:branched-chain amino acid ABC transporter permease [Chloroflexota bacterium]